MIKAEIDTRVSSIQLDEENVLYVRIKPDSAITLSDAEETTNAIVKLVDQYKQPMVLLINTQGTKSMAAEARQHLGNAQAGQVLARAIVLGSPVSRAIASFFLKVNKPLIPSKMFTDDNEALDWLKSFLK